MRSRRLHKLLALVVCVPCLLWGLSGALLAWKNWARDTQKPPSGKPPPPEQPFVVSAAQVLTQLQAQGRPQPQKLEWRHVVGAPRYLVQYESPKEVVVIDGETGQIAPPIDDREALRIADAAAPLGSQALAVAFQSEPSLVYLAGFELPVYRVAISDGSEIYVSPRTGEVILRADRMAWWIRSAYFGLHVWRVGSGPGPYRSYLVLLVFAVGLVAAATSGLWLALRPSQRRG
ncbi:MAG: PepSY domain-containing protein [Myxococcales bacterium]|nr:PepSY domain-containing protein [Myxococcales bacterium]